MGQDLRELLKQDMYIPSQGLNQGHEVRFLSKIENELPTKKKRMSFKWLQIAASIVVLFSISFYSYDYIFLENTNVSDGSLLNTKSEVKNATVVMPKQTSSLAQISPEYEKAENYFLTNIKFELSQINIDDTNKELVKSFMNRLENLDKEYKELNKELIDIGPNPQSVEAMMENLSLRLSLLNRLKSKLKELDKIQNENYIDIQA